MKILFAISFALFLTYQIQAQTFKKNSLDHLKEITKTTTHANDVRSKYRKTEYFILFFELDSVGKVKGIHLMSDDNNRDSGYAAFKKLTPEMYKEWHSEEFKGKTIVLPVYCVGIEQTPATSNDYLKYQDYPPLNIPEGCDGMNGKNKYVFCQQLVYLWPSTSTSH